MAIFFVVISVGKTELVEVVKIVAKKLGKEYRDVGLRDICSEKKLVCILRY